MSLVTAGLRGLRGTLSPVLGAVRAMSLEPPPEPPEPSLGSLGSLGSLRVTRPREHILHVELNRPHRRNAMDSAFWREMVSCFGAIAQDPSCRAVVISGAGPVFTAGIDLASLGPELLALPGEDAARRAWSLRRKIRDFQESFSALEKCPKPIIAAIHGACVGAGVDLISACDIRFCSQDAWFQVKEVDIGLAADVGTLQRLPKIVGSQSLVNELAFTARKMMAPEAQSCGLVRDHSVPEGLRYVATWNMAMLQTDDVLKSAQAAMDRKGPEDVPFAKL
ncbi:delta(3,5)-Delta(2,4)-dienoyl-CoA isomerase, mitochondrial isoform X2 [Patagioenas fasciata]|uniref:delta(3,5)-Delta(2,4)-dienoyl-CoA isomerase, mitochondrial isoform X2 n=1 Tax=Patagioenas fasciata TaxID=372321 RepID=UPI003A9972E1